MPRVDIQGIRWQHYFPVTREEFRESRIMNYGNFKNLQIPHDPMMHDIIRPRTDAEFYKFLYTKERKKTRCWIYHPQLRNLVWATSKNDVYYPHEQVIRNWCPLTRSSRRVMELGATRLSTISAGSGCLMAGSCNGTYLFRRLAPNSPIVPGTITEDENGITNYIQIETGRSGESQAFISSNDKKARILNLNRLQITHEHAFDWAVNCSSISPDRRLLCVSGDAKDSLIVSADSGDVLVQLTGHMDYTFACAWSPCGRLLATGNQDMTTRIYDVRFPSHALAALPANLGAVRSLRFSDDNCFLAAAEPADFVHVYDVRAGGVGGREALLALTPPRAHDDSPLLVGPPKGEESADRRPGSSEGFEVEQEPGPDSFVQTSNFESGSTKPAETLRSFIIREAEAVGLLKKSRHHPGTSDAAGSSDRNLFRSQVIDFFGEIGGFAFSPDGSEFLFVGNADHKYGSILEFERTHSKLSKMLEDFL
ncbi:WD40-repeat-containing domain protein [Zopfochytrium polystomum]|nr:WD40-repeat-containing domain protein [Zopfochytrium polystomum]